MNFGANVLQTMPEGEVGTHSENGGFGIFSSRTFDRSIARRIQYALPVVGLEICQGGVCYLVALVCYGVTTAELLRSNSDSFLGTLLAPATTS